MIYQDVSFLHQVHKTRNVCVISNYAFIRLAVIFIPIKNRYIRPFRIRTFRSRSIWSIQGVNLMKTTPTTDHNLLYVIRQKHFPSYYLCKYLCLVFAQLVAAATCGSKDCIIKFLNGKLLITISTFIQCASSS